MKTHGGTCIYIKEDVEFTELPNISQHSEELHCECTCIKIENLQLIILCVYRSNNGDLNRFFNIFTEILTILLEKAPSYTIIVCGDFNLNLLMNDRNVKQFKDLLNTFNLQQTIHQPTRVTANTNTLIDNIFVSSKVICRAHVLATALSDHHGQLLQLPTQKRINHESIQHKRVYTNKKIEDYKCELLKLDWDDVIYEPNVNTAYNVFILKLTHLHKQIFPKKKMKNKKQGINWITKGIKISCQNKRKMFVLNQHGLIENDHFKKYVKYLRKVIRAAKKMANIQYLEKAPNKAKATWTLVKQVTSNHDARNSNTKHLCKDSSDPKLTAEKINQHFINVCPLLNSNGSANMSKIQLNTNSIFFEPSTPNEIYNIIHGLKNIKSVGIDEIPMNLIKHTADVICVPLSYLINQSFVTGVFPDELKISILKLIHKKGSKENINNYRPISILSNISKIFEKATFNRLINFLETQRLLTENQNGFRKKKSTIRAIYQGMAEVLSSLNNKKTTSMLLLDLSKAFDSVHHAILLEKLYKYGVRGVSHSLIKNYLSSRKQITELTLNTNHVYRSSPATTLMGVPQGSILGPLLFIVYTNDVDKILNENTYLYADDTNIIFSGTGKNEVQRRMSLALNTLSDWFTDNNIKLNLDKTQIINFAYKTTNKVGLEITHRSKILRSVESASFLGITVDSRLDWKDQVDKICNNISKYCYALKVLAKTTNRKTVLASYHAYVMSCMRYGIIFWGNSTDANRVFVLQKKCVRGVFGMAPMDSCKETFKHHNLLTFYSLYIYEAILFVTENLSLFEQYHMTHKYETRRYTDLQPDTPRATYILKNVNFMIMSIYNRIPTSIRTLPPKQLKIAIKSYLIKKCYYSLEEFLNENHQQIQTF